MANKHARGHEVRYCHEGQDRYAQVTEVHPDTGEVLGLVVYDEERDPATDKVVARNVSHGVLSPTPATEPAHRITHGHFWKQ